MAASARPARSKPMSRRRELYGQESRSRRGAHNEQQHLSRSPPRQVVWSPPAMSLASNSTTSLNTPLDHPHSITMERTPSGNSILSDTRFEHEQPNHTLSSRDLEAAGFVLHHMERQRHRNHEDILKGLIKRTGRIDDLDDKALDGILTTADSVFFAGTLKGRVQWEWSSQDRYHNELIGTTALRRCSDRDGYETLIVLSAPILKSYDRRLLLSAFLHELIHCYLFIRCGFEARMQGGHTDGFHRIARAIHDWVEEWHPGYLDLCNMKANLNRFDRTRPPMYPVDPRIDVFRDERRHGHEGCNQSPRPDGHVLGESGVPGYF